MKTMTYLGVVALTGLLVSLPGCGDDEGDTTAGPTGTGGGTATGTATGTGGNGTGGEGGVGGNGTGGNGTGGNGTGGNGGQGGTGGEGGEGGEGGGNAGATVNGCAPADFVSAVTVANQAASYNPPCVKIAKNGVVTFTGTGGNNFNSHPLQGGTVVNNAGTPDANSPIGFHDGGNTPKVVQFPDAGTYGFYCTAHVGQGMYGAVLVE